MKQQTPALFVKIYSHHFNDLKGLYMYKSLHDDNRWLINALFADFSHALDVE